MAPYYGPNEDTRSILLERVFLASELIIGVGYGIQLVLYASCAHYLWKTRHLRRWSLFLLAYMTLLLLGETMYVIAQSSAIQMMYVDNRNYPGGPWAYFFTIHDLPIYVIFISSRFSITFLADILVLWRCWVIWRARGQAVAWLAISFPALMLLVSFVMGTLWTLQSSQPGLSLYSASSMTYGTSYYAISLVANITLTILITIRLLLYRRTILKVFPKEYTKDVLSLLAILIESASLYSIFALIFVVTYAINSVVNCVFLGVASCMQQIANYLIIYRLALGRAWDKDTLVQTHTNMEFRLDHHDTSSSTAGSGRSMDDFEIREGDLTRRIKE